MSTVRSIDRRISIRRQVDRELAAARATAPAVQAERVGWGGVWAGYVVFVGVATLLLFFVLGIGFSTVNPLDVASWQSIGTGVATWSVVVLLIATFIGAWMGSARPGSSRGGAYFRGVLLWGMIMVSMVLVSGWMAGKALTFAGSAAAAVSSTVQQVAPATIISSLQREGVTITQPQATVISARLAVGDRFGAANALSEAAGIPTSRAQLLISSIAGPALQSAQGATRQAARGAALGGSAVTWGFFWLALLSLGAALLGSMVGGGGAVRRFRTVKQPQQAA